SPSPTSAKGSSTWACAGSPRSPARCSRPGCRPRRLPRPSRTGRCRSRWASSRRSGAWLATSSHKGSGARRSSWSATWWRWLGRTSPTWRGSASEQPFEVGEDLGGCGREAQAGTPSFVDGDHLGIDVEAGQPGTPPDEVQAHVVEDVDADRSGQLHPSAGDALDGRLVVVVPSAVAGDRNVPDLERARGGHELRIAPLEGQVVASPATAPVIDRDGPLRPLGNPLGAIVDAQYCPDFVDARLRNEDLPGHGERLDAARHVHAAPHDGERTALFRADVADDHLTR